MMLNVYALRDRVADNFRSVTINESDDLEKRNLAFAVTNDVQFQFLSKDLELCHIAQLDNKSGVVTPVIPIRVVVRCDQLIGGDKNDKV